MPLGYFKNHSVKNYPRKTDFISGSHNFYNLLREFKKQVENDGIFITSLQNKPKLRKKKLKTVQPRL